MLYRQVADAFSRVEPAVRLQCARRTGIDAIRTIPTARLDRLVGGQFKVGDYFPQQQLRAELRTC